MLAREVRRGPSVNWRETRNRTTELLERLHLSVGSRQ